MAESIDLIDRHYQVLVSNPNNETYFQLTMNTTGLFFIFMEISVSFKMAPAYNKENHKHLQIQG